MSSIRARAAAVALAALSVCGGKVDQGADGGDGGPWVCGDVAAPPELTASSPGVCDDKSKAACQVWAQSLVHEATAYTCCGSAAPPPNELPLRCWMGGPDCSYGPQAMKAGCGAGGTCASCSLSQSPACLPYDQVCVTDASNNTPHCVFACSE
jgi:hypothetical protein